ncbi:MAG: hypothetical protein R3C99_25315 [Pirellulaceae bacterium]|nr:hypothetical protein [Planctomycetales bacterium]
MKAFFRKLALLGLLPSLLVGTTWLTNVNSACGQYDYEEGEWYGDYEDEWYDPTDWLDNNNYEFDDAFGYGFGGNYYDHAWNDNESAVYDDLYDNEPYWDDAYSYDRPYVNDSPGPYGYDGPYDYDAPHRYDRPYGYDAPYAFDGYDYYDYPYDDDSFTDDYAYDYRYDDEPFWDDFDEGYDYYTGFDEEAIDEQDYPYYDSEGLGDIDDDPYDTPGYDFMDFDDNEFGDYDDYHAENYYTNDWYTDDWYDDGGTFYNWYD